MAKYSIDKYGNVTVNKNYKSTPKYNVDENGNITSNLSLPATKKKPKYTIDINGNVISNIEPVNEEKVTTSKKKKKEKDTWFKSGAFGDGKGNFFTDALATVGSTVLDVGVGAFKGATGFVEGITDLGMYGVAGAADLLGADGVAKSINKSAEKSFTENLYKPAEKFADKYSVLGNKSDSVSETLGQIAIILGTGGIAGTLGLGAAGTTALVTGTNFASSFGSGMSEAYNDNASGKEALIYGAIKGGIDAGSELLFGGLGKAVNATGISSGIGGFDDMFADYATKKITNQVVKNAAKYGIKAAGEGAEEVLAGIGTAFAKQATYKSEEEIGKLLEDENLLDQFIVGAVAGGITSTPSLKKSITSGRDYTSGLTVNEQKVVDAEVQRRIAEQETNGKKLSKKQQSAIIEEVQEDVKKGYISTDVIESTLVGESETYKNYQSVTKQEQVLMQKIKEIENDATLTTTQKNDLTNAFKNEIKALNKKQVVGKFVTEMDALTQKDTYLRESYNELGRSEENFTVDLSKYNDKEKEVLQAAMDSGVVGNSNRMHEFVEPLAKMYSEKGIFFKFTNNEKIQEEGRDVEGATVNGYITDDGVVVLNVDSMKSLNTIVGHEITHTFETEKAQYAGFQDLVIELSKTRGDYDTKWQQIQKSYSDERLKSIYGKDADFEAIRKAELTADLIGDYLFTDRKFIEELSVKQPNIFKRIYEEIKYLLKTFTGSKEARQLEQVKRAFDKAYKQTSNVTNITENVKYELEAIANMTEESYNHHGWAKVNDILTDTELADFQSKVGEKNKNGKWYLELGNDRYMFAVGENGVNSTLIISDGDFNAPSIEKVYHIGLNNETDIETVRDVIYESEKDGEWTLSSVAIEEVYGNEIVRSYTGKDFETFQQQSRRYEGTKSKVDIRFDSELQDGSGSNTEAKISINDEVSSTDDAFFDAQNDDIKYSLSSEESISDKINAAMTMKEAKDMLQRVYNAGDIRGYRNADEWLNDMGTEDVAMTLESDYALYKKYIEGNEDILNEVYSIEDVLEAYVNGTLVGKKKESAIRLDTSKDTGFKDDRFYAPQDIKGGQDLYNIANQRVTNANRAEVYKARADFIINAHNKGYVEALGLTREEVNKKLKSWANYTPKAMTLSNSLNEGVATQNRWTGIENSTILNTITISEEEMGKLVKKIEGKSSDWQRQYITSTMLALDTHIDYKDLSFEFDGAGMSSKTALGEYSDSERTIRIRVAGQNTVAHEMGHYIDHQWGRDLGYAGNDGLTGRGIHLDKLTAEQKQFVKNFYTFLSDIENSSDIGSSYKMASNEVFARFVARFTEWTKNQATNNRYGYEEKWYKDNFTERQYREFVKILQEKALLDTTIPASNTATRYSLSEDNQGRKLSKEQQEYFKDSKAVDDKGHLLEVYHGTKTTGINKFEYSPDRQTGDDFGEAYYFTSDYVKALGYSYDVNKDERVKQYQSERERLKKKFLETRAEEDIQAFLNVKVEGKTLHELMDDETYNTGGEVKNVYLNLVNPLIVDAEGEYHFKVYDKYFKEAKSGGYDGLIVKNVIDNPRGEQRPIDVYIAFNANQIKAVDNTNPTSNPDIRYSLSGENQDIAPVGSYNVYGRDIALKTKESAVVEDIAPVREVAELPTPLTEEMANERDAEQQNINTLVDAPEEIEAPYYAKDEDIKLEDPFDERDIKDVGKRNVKAYMYDNPEVKPYFQQEAQAMLWELQNSVKGEKSFNSQLYYDTNGELGWFGTTRETSDDIAYLLDNFKYTYADIEKGLKAIIEDHGAENNAISKRIEFALNDRLKDGYTDFMSGEDVPANQDYVNLLMDKQIYTYSDEAYYEWLQSLATEEAPPVAPLEPSTDDRDVIAPVREDIETPEGTQRVMDFENNQIVDEFESDTKEQENKLYHKSRKELKQALIKDRENFLIDAMDNAKNVPALLLNNTDTIRATELVFGRENAKVINKEIFQKAIDNEAKSIAWQNKERADIKKLGIKPKSKESAAVQKYGEKQYENAEGKMVEYGDIELATEFPDTATQKKIKRAAQVMRDKYDSYIDEANAVLTELGFNPIQKRKDYMRHFEALTDAFSRMGIPFNIQQMKEYDLPTDINGLTDTFVPQKNFFANIMERKGNKTTLDAVTGIDGYIGGISNLIHHTEDIQRGRAFEDLIRDNYGRKEADKVLSGIVDETAKQKRKQQIADNHLSSYASWVHDWTDNLAGKKDIADRGAERRVGRRIFTVLDTIRKQVGANMIGFNVASSLTNLIAPVQALAKTDKIAFTKGTIDTFKSIFKKDSFMENNSFLTSRMGTDKLSKTWWEKTQDAGFIFMRGMDYFTSNLIVRSKYNELISKGVSEEVAHKEAGQFAARIMGDRTKGANAQLYNSKLFNMVAQFQLEVNNQLYSMFYDTYHESKEKAEGNAARTASGMTFTLGQLFIATHIFGQAFEEIAGYNPTFDLIDIIKTALGLDDEEEEKPLDERLEDASLKLLKALPYSNLFVDGGRIPMGDALPITQFIKGEDEYGNEKPRGETFMEALPYYLLPAGYGQMKKTEKGLNMFDESLPVTGSYTDSGNLRFPVEDTASNRIQAAIFGQWANENARDYINNERQPLKEKQIQEFADLDIPIKEYWEYREGLKEQKTVEDKFDYIAGLDLPVSKKNILINNVVDREEKVNLINYDDFSGYEEFDFAIKNPEKYEFFKNNNISYADYSASEESKEAYSWAYNNPEKYVVSKAIGDVVQYKQYSKALNELTADKDEDGKSISGSRKEKVINYINSMQADYGAKIVLYKSEYPSDDTYNNEIVEYLNNRNDITYEDMVTILIELGFTVEADGTVRWD